MFLLITLICAAMTKSVIVAAVAMSMLHHCEEQVNVLTEDHALGKIRSERTCTHPTQKRAVN